MVLLAYSYEHFLQKLHVYQRPLEFVKISAEIIKKTPRGQSYWSVQLKRSASSIVLNIREGAGEFAKKEKARFYTLSHPLEIVSDFYTLYLLEVFTHTVVI